MKQLVIEFQMLDFVYQLFLIMYKSIISMHFAVNERPACQVLSY